MNAVLPTGRHTCLTRVGRRMHNAVFEAFHEDRLATDPRLCRA